MSMLAREANLQQARLERVSKVDENEFDFKMSDREHERYDMIVECKDDESLTGRSNLLLEPLRSRTVSFTIPNCSEVLIERQSQSSKEKKRTNVVVTSGGLIFMLIAAALVTATFLMSPVIENIFCKYSLLSYVFSCRAMFLSIAYFLMSYGSGKI